MEILENWREKAVLEELIKLADAGDINMDWISQECNLSGG